MSKLLLKTTLAVFSLSVCALVSPNRADAQFFPFGYASEYWSSPTPWSGCGNCLPNTYSPVVTNSVEGPGCCSPEYSTPKTQNPGPCGPGGCGPCQDNSRKVLMKSSPSFADVGIRDRSQLGSGNSKSQVLGVEHVIPSRRKPLLAERVIVRDVAKRFPENEGWIPVSPQSIRSRDQRVTSTR